MIARLGLHLDWSDPEPDEDGVFGRDIAVDGFCEALMRHGRPGVVRFFRNSPLLRPGPVEDRRLAALAAPGVEPRFAEMRTLKAEFGAHPFRAWHDLDGNLSTARDLRRRYSDRLYPVTATPHVFSYEMLRHNWILRMLLQDNPPCDAMICPTPSARDSLGKLAAWVSDGVARDFGVKDKGPPRVDVIPLGVDTDRFRPRDRRQTRRKLDLPDEATILLWVGRLSPLDKADLLPLLHVFSQLRPAGDSPLLLVVGGSGHRFVRRSLKDYARRLGVAERVIFRAVPPARRELFHAAADLFVSPADNIQETFGITPVEAMASGTPQVVAAWNGYKDTVQDEVTGLLVPTMLGLGDSDAGLGAGVYDEFDLFDHLLMAQQTIVDPEALRCGLQRLIDDPARRRTMGEASRARALERYAWPVVIAAYEALWDELEEIAAATHWELADRHDYTSPRLSALFSHYASSRLAPDDTIGLSPAGRGVLRRDAPLPAYHAALGAISVDALRSALALLDSRSHSHSDLQSQIIGIARCRPDAAAIAIAWLLKMGFARRI